MVILLQHLQLLVANLECVGLVMNDAIFYKLHFKARNDAVYFLYLLLEEHRGWCSVEPQQQNLSVYFTTINILKQSIEWSFHWGNLVKSITLWWSWHINMMYFFWLSYFLLDKFIRLFMSSILSLVALSLGRRDEVIGPEGFFAKTVPTSLWMEDISESSLFIICADF